MTRTSNDTDFDVLTTVRVLAKSPGLAVCAPARLCAYDIGLPNLSNLNGCSLFWLFILSFPRWASSPARFLEPNDNRPFVFALSY
jgi:hypothetical protein